MEKKRSTQGECWIALPIGLPIVLEGDAETPAKLGTEHPILQLEKGSGSNKYPGIPFKSKAGASFLGQFARIFIKFPFHLLGFLVLC